ncbi:hypothetical protein TOPH_03515 [Tolypocladium ophioglossoides CBS 100239]|uniref:Uncharacterized protein n=1 Tax=Tolypocladium ophioglossoides (strain CBS 100239) TaxID=1163406 RepID=A0A0L0NCV2_TOLOC|nr:hypothetical protein TOPH_03515 [Tolypocladium ophioglossoides CBS 100239]
MTTTAMRNDWERGVDTQTVRGGRGRHKSAGLGQQLRGQRAPGVHQSSLLAGRADSVTPAPYAKHAPVDAQPDESPERLTTCAGNLDQTGRRLETELADDSKRKQESTTAKADRNILLSREGIAESSTRLSSPQLCTVGWIIALDKELAAARAVLDERHRKPDNFKSTQKTQTPIRGVGLDSTILSSPRSPLEGVVQYDLGKLRSSGKFERVGNLNGPPEILLKRLVTLQYPKMRESGPDGDVRCVT